VKLDEEAPSPPTAGTSAGPDGPPIDARVPFHTVGFTVSSIGHAVARRFKETLAPLELEPREFALLRAVGADEGQSQQAIGERQQIPPSRMVAFVDALQERGLLERRLNPHDRRTRALYLTDSGRELLLRAFALATAVERDLCADLSSSEREELIDLLWRVGLRLGVAPGTHSATARNQCDEP
jgi:DNA-binding MarR family transcriptional regulator